MSLMLQAEWLGLKLRGQYNELGNRNSNLYCSLYDNRFSNLELKLLWSFLMRMFCKNCGKKFYPTDDGWVGYPQGYWRNRTPAEQRVFHSRTCWEDWTSKNQEAYTNWLQQFPDYDINSDTNNN